ncbi:MAG TPA: ATP-dependent sacrificial sulfur transferase LarE [Nocardioidaceae bacterium]|nr:ATP-dependent sacrificial sulfur transferase LarE [Nocardioidaceae bacterium]
MTTLPATPLVVGFDLDMTLIDSRPGVRAVWEELARLTGTPIDAGQAASRLGPPLTLELGRWFPSDQIEPMAQLYRSLYPGLAIEPTPAMPGAADALAAVRRHGGRSLVVTAKHEGNAELHVQHLDLPVDTVVGGLWGEGKAAALGEHAASVYVGDHVLDVAGARAAGALSVAVASGPCSAEELAGAGADVILDDLTQFVPWLDGRMLDRRLAALETRLRALGSVLVAFSGGADSALLLAAAVRALDPSRVAAATAVSGSLPDTELAAARRFAAELGVRWLSPHTHEMEREGYRANAGDRCYFCKAELLEVLGPMATAHGLACVATGTNADDIVAGFRPGIRAAAERGAVTPLLDAGLTKDQVRAASARWGLPTWDKPAAACLSSRIAYGVEVTPHRLARVERAEVGLRAVLATAGRTVRDLRVRDLGDGARVEVDRDLVSWVRDSAEASAVLADAGFSAAEVDPRGFRSGSMNELLTDRERYR